MPRTKGTRSPATDTSASPSGQSGAPVRGETNPTIARAAASRPEDVGFTTAVACSCACTTDLHRTTRTTRTDHLTHVEGEGYVPCWQTGP